MSPQPRSCSYLPEQLSDSVRSAASHGAVSHGRVRVLVPPSQPCHSFQFPKVPPGGIENLEHNVTAKSTAKNMINSRSILHGYQLIIN